MKVLKTMSSIFAVVSIGLLIGCQKRSSHRNWESIKKSRTLKVLTLNSETTFFENRDGKKTGLEYDLVRLFSRQHNLKPKFMVRNTPAELFLALERGEGDLIAAGLTVTPGRRKKYAFGPSYQTTTQKVVCRPSISPKTLESLQNYEVVVGQGTSYIERLDNLKKEYEGLSWEVSKDETSAELIKKLSDSDFDCTIADDHIIDIYRRYFPSLNVGLNIGTPQDLAWAMLKSNSRLQAEVEKWFIQSRRSIASLVSGYYSHLDDFDPFDVKTFRRRISTRLPKYELALKKAAEEFGWSWTFLAAVAYQESHWNPKAKSPTGVRGFMMLTRPTAKAMGVKNRLDPAQSIWGGAKYLRRLKSRIPSYIRGQDRDWMTLAAYNVGFAHLRDARAVSVWQEQNPNSWEGVREALPLLASKSVYKRLPHGYARGLEPVLYVDRIRNYHNILKQYLRGQ
jgi:membrane-bound lytic murein transglycosylase F